MLSLERIKELIQNPDVYLANTAINYFDDSLSEDEEILNIVLDRCLSLNEDEQSLLLGSIISLKLNYESLNKIITLLPSASPKLRGIYERLISNADISLLKNSGLDIQSLMPDLRIILNQKLQISTYSTSKLLEELQSYSSKNDTKYIDEFDHRYGRFIADELAKRDDLDEEKIIDTLTSIKFDEYGYYECYLLALSGKRRLSTLIPLFIEGLGDNSDLISEESMYALMRIGTADIVGRITDKFLDAEDDFKIFAAGTLENIKLVESEHAALKLLKEETDATIKTLLAGALCRLYSAEALPLIKELIEEGYDSSMLNLEEYAYVNCVFNGLNIPEMLLWKEGYDEERGFYASLLAVKPPAISETKVGRNDPCPCGSGKKYKKCCGKN